MSKPDRLKARLPRGFADRNPVDLAATQRMLDRIRQVYELYGFEAMDTPFAEYTDSLGKFLPDLDRPNEGVFSFQDDDEQWLSLRYDLTAPLARHVAARLDEQNLTLPFRSYRAGWVFRNEKPGPGRFRQFMQFDADTVGSDSIAADAEICMMAADTLEAVGIPRGQYVIKVNNRKVLDGLMDVVGLGATENVPQRTAVLRAIDKLDRLGVDAVQHLLGPGRKDESGDFTKGAGLSDQAISRVLNFTGWGEQGSGSKSTIDANHITIENFRDAVAGSAVGAEGVDELEIFLSLLAVGGYIADDGGRVLIDPSVVRGLEYYTGPVFEAELTFEVKDDDGRNMRFGSVGGGGRYDGLVGRFRPEPVPATGFSIGVSRLLAALQHIRSPIVMGGDAPGPVVVLVMDRDPARIGDYQRMVATLRGAGIPAEMYLGAAGMKAQMKYADRRRAPCVVIQGSDEKAKGEVQLKDLRAGTAQAGSARGLSNEEYRSARIAQVSIQESHLVAEVRKILGVRND